MSEITHIEPTLPWAEARAAFLAAYGAENLYDAMAWTPAYQASKEDGDARVTSAICAEQERLTDVRCAAEEVMIAAPAPDMAAVFAKIEYARHRWSDCPDWPPAWWNAVLADLRRPVEDPHMGWLAERDELLRRYNSMPNAFDDGADLLRSARELEQRIQSTAATGRDGLLAKALLVVAEEAMGMDEDAKAVFAEASAMGLIEFVS